MPKPRIVVGISGATGFQYGTEVLRLLRKLGAETHLVMSNAADLTRAKETKYAREDVIQMADVFYPGGAVGAAISSGSFLTAGMIIAPCSMHTLAAVAHSMTDNLLTRAADVVLKERRRLVLMVRETPLHLGHIRNMASVTELGAIVFPPVPALYAAPQTVEQVVAHSAARAISIFGFESVELPRWGDTLEDIKDEVKNPDEYFG